MRPDPPVVTGTFLIDVVRDLIAEVLTISHDSIQPESALMRDLGAESIDFLDLVFRIEDMIGRRIPVGTWERYVDERLPAGNHATTITPEIVREFAEREACRP